MVRTNSSDEWKDMKRPGSWDVLNFELLCDSKNKFGIPDLEPSHFDTRSFEVEPYGGRKRDVVCHFFLDDYRMERVFTRRWKCLPAIQSYPHVFTPDFSTWSDMPWAMQLWNVYRSRWCGAFWQSMEVSVSCTVQWGDEESFEFCFEGIPKNSLLSISVPNLRMKANAENFRLGIDAMFRRCEPRSLFIMGKPTDDPDTLIPKAFREGLDFIDFRLQRAYTIQRRKGSGKSAS